MSDALNEIQAAIKMVCEQTKAGTKLRRQGLQAVQWVLKGSKGYVATNGVNTRYDASKDEATFYDGCDNELAKQRFFSILAGEPLTLEFL